MSETRIDEKRLDVLKKKMGLANAGVVDNEGRGLGKCCVMAKGCQFDFA
jgi:hypothetical protein